MTIGSSSGWLMLAGMIARPRATSLRTSSAGIPSRSATNSISSVISPRRAYCSWVMAPRAAKHRAPEAVRHQRQDRRRCAGRCRRPRAPGSRAPQRRQSLPHVVALRPGRVVHAERRLAARQRDLAHRHADAARALEVDLGGLGKRLGVALRRRRGDGVGRAGRTGMPGAGGHRGRSKSRADGVAALARRSRAPHSLRRYQPDQVPRVTSQSGGAAATGMPLAACEW